MEKKMLPISGTRRTKDGFKLSCGHTVGKINEAVPFNVFDPKEDNCVVLLSYCKSCSENAEYRKHLVPDDQYSRYGL